LSIAHSTGSLPVWVDGRVVRAEDARLDLRASVASAASAHYTTALVRAGEPAHAARHVARLARDARQLGLPRIDERAASRALALLARAAFAARDGAIRLQHFGDASGGSRLVGIPRELGSERAAWRAITAPLAHEGPRPWSGAKLAANLACDIARDAAARAGADEALFADASGRLVEGARTNVFVHLADGTFATPDLARGGVCGIAREIALERARGELRVRDIGLRALHSAREIVVVNALRGARPVVELDGTPVGAAHGPLATRLAELLARD